MNDLDVVARLDSLEAKVARLATFTAVFALAAVVTIFWLLTRTPKTLAAQRYVLRDSSGDTRGEWAPSGVVTGSENDKPIEASTTCLTMHSQKRSRASLCAPWEEPGGEPSLNLHHSTGSQASIIAGAFNGQVVLTARANPDDRQPTTLALLMASHVDSAVTLRHDKLVSSWSSTGALSHRE